MRGGFSREDEPEVNDSTDLVVPSKDGAGNESRSHALSAFAIIDACPSALPALPSVSSPPNS